MCEFNDKLHLNKSPFIKPSNGQMLSVLLITVLLSSVCVQFNHLRVWHSLKHWLTFLLFQLLCNTNCQSHFQSQLDVQCGPKEPPHWVSSISLVKFTFHCFVHSNFTASGCYFQHFNRITTETMNPKWLMADQLHHLRQRCWILTKIL